MSRATPGPWRVAGIVPNFHVRGGNPDELIADCAVGRNRPGEDLANARLIAAAPDLLAACEAALPYVLGHSSMSCGGKCNMCAARAQLRAALAKARPTNTK